MIMWDPTYLLLIPGLVLAMLAQMKLMSTYQRYAREKSAKGYAGAQVAQMLLQAYGVRNVEIVMGTGQLTDHYDPRKRNVVLSPEVYQGTSVAAVAVAAHETGHAIQHNEGYVPLSIRSAFAPWAYYFSSLAMPLFFVGLLFGYFLATQVGIYLFMAVIVFQLVTLPVEFNASTRAMLALAQCGIVTEEEYPWVKKMLSAAALTYIAALTMSVLHLVRMLAISGRRRR